MTVDELLERLRDDWMLLENKFIPAYEKLGRDAFTGTRDCIESSKKAIGDLHRKQSEITRTISLIKETIKNDNDPTPASE